ncbi:CASP-like protein 1E2 [Quercus suber]|uniref:CASP-like protein n=1 Tax=Quercus suber TaxID=58331 RepID=A0AAW0KY65_QUESU|nr:CASP-like protein 1E2 [Quercus suber]POF00312.1 casp-like protein 1e2 [Quercus suber]
MESQNKVSMGGMDGLESREKEMKMANQRTAKSRELLVRLLAFALTFVAAILFGVNKQTKVVSLQLTPTLPPFNVPVTAKWHYLSAFVYFVASNAIACSYAALSILLLFTSKGENNIVPKMIIILDTLMVALIFSGNGAATAIALMGYKGNSHVQWKEVCSVFGKFCDQGAVAIGLSQLGALAFLLLVLMPTLSSNKRSSNY